jgi:hypothetical protein
LGSSHLDRRLVAALSPLFTEGRRPRVRFSCDRSRRKLVAKSFEHLQKPKIVARLASFRRLVARRQWDQAYDFVATAKKVVVSQSQLQWDRGLTAQLL